jgi:hypothetical protein
VLTGVLTAGAVEVAGTVTSEVVARGPTGAIAVLCENEKIRAVASTSTTIAIAIGTNVFDCICSLV